METTPRRQPSPNSRSPDTAAAVADVEMQHRPRNAAPSTMASSSNIVLPADVNPALLPVIGLKSRSSSYTDIEVHVHLDKPNPWDFLEAYKQPYYDINGSKPTAAQPSLPYQSRELFRLTDLPLEIICCIAEVLPPESAACLALVNKTFYKVLASRSLELQPYSRWRLLVLLEKDLLFLAACADCMTLHSALITWDENSGMSCLNKCQERGIPQPITHPIVRTLAKAHLQNKSYGEILGYTSEYFTHFGKSLQYNWSYSCRLVRGSLLQRRQIVLRPRRGDVMTMRSLYRLAEVCDPGYFSPLCHHQAWSRASSADLRVFAATLADRHDQAHHNTTDGGGMAKHRELCFSGRDALEAVGEEGLSAGMTKTLHRALFAAKPRGKVGKVRGCKRCFTDYCVAFVDVEGAGRCIVLTAWKDLGGLGPSERAKWDSHMTVPLFEWHGCGVAGERVADRGEAQLGRVYCAWEGVDPETFDVEKHLYAPELGQRLARELKEAADQRHEHDSQLEADTDEPSESEESHESEGSDESNGSDGSDESDDH